MPTARWSRSHRGSGFTFDCAKKGERDVLSYDAVSQSEPFTAVTLRQSDVLRLWPVTGEVLVLAATVIDKGERPAEYDRAAINRIRADKPSKIFGIAKRARSSRQLDRANEVLRGEFPNGVPPNLTDKQIQSRIVPVFKEKGWKLPSIDTIARARGRRKVG